MQLLILEADYDAKAEVLAISKLIDGVRLLGSALPSTAGNIVRLATAAVARLVSVFLSKAPYSLPTTSTTLELLAELSTLKAANRVSKYEDSGPI